mgnify:CR=1 FL=1
MLSLYVKARNLMASDEGATAVEYGIMVALIAVIIIAAVTLVGEQLAVVCNSVATELGGVAR